MQPSCMDTSHIKHVYNFHRNEIGLQTLRDVENVEMSIYSTTIVARTISVLFNSVPISVAYL